MTFHCSCIFR